jgi:hypothetical protein
LITSSTQVLSYGITIVFHADHEPRDLLSIKRMNHLLEQFPEQHDRIS